MKSIKKVWEIYEKNMKVMGSAPGEKQISVSRVGSGEVRGSSGSAATQNIFQPSQINV